MLAISGVYGHGGCGTRGVSAAAVDCGEEQKAKKQEIENIRRSANVNAASCK